MKQVPQGVTAIPPTEEAHETQDVNLRKIFLFGFALLVGMAVVFGVVTVWQFLYLGMPSQLAQPPSYATAPNAELPPQPRFEEIPGANLAILRAREDVLLNSYGWVDEDSEQVRIPIQRAMELMVERGFPVLAEDAGNTFEEAGNLIPSYSSSGRAMEKLDP